MVLQREILKYIPILIIKEIQEKSQVLIVNYHKGLPVDTYPSIETQFTVLDIKEIPFVDHILWLN
jgi:hypothetical protein